jgi:hypothetical protein
VVLILIPLKPNIAPRLAEICRQRASALAVLSDFEVKIDDRGPGDGHVDGLVSRVKHTAPIRQSLIDDYLKDHSHVLWIDADIIVYTPEIVQSLFETSKEKKAIVAPQVLWDETDNRFYDIGGFIDGGKYCSPTYPYFKDTTSRFVELDSVGAFYIVPADIYRAGAKHAFNPEHPTDHMGVCQFGKKLGYKILCDTHLSVYHCWFPTFGEVHW